MPTTTIPWGDGSGDNIYLSAPSQTGDQSVSVTSDANTGAARSKVVTFNAVGVTPVSLTINQEAGGVTPQQYTIALNPSSYDENDYAYASLQNPTRAYTNETSTNYCQIALVTGAGAETYVYFKFDTSSIPAGATIDEVSCTAKTYISNSSDLNIQTREWQLFSGTTPKGSAVTFPSSASAAMVSGASWSSAEVADIRIRMYAKRGPNNVNNTFYIRFYGATLTIKYTI